MPTEYKLNQEFLFIKSFRIIKAKEGLRTSGQ